MIRAGHVTPTGDKRGEHRVLVGGSDGYSRTGDGRPGLDCSRTG